MENTAIKIALAPLARAEYPLVFEHRCAFKVLVQYDGKEYEGEVSYQWKWSGGPQNDWYTRLYVKVGHKWRKVAKNSKALSVIRAAIQAWGEAEVATPEGLEKLRQLQAEGIKQLAEAQARDLAEKEEYLRREAECIAAEKK